MWNAGDALENKTRGGFSTAHPARAGVVLASKAETDWLMAEAPAKVLHMRVHARTAPQTSTHKVIRG